MTELINTDWVSGLRELADWLEQNPRLSIGGQIGNVKPFKACRQATVAKARELAAEHGFVNVVEYPNDIDGVVREVLYERKFGPLTVEVWGEDSVSEEWLEQHRVRRPRLRDRVRAVFS